MEALANLVVVAHLAYFLFVVGGSVGILIGLAQRRQWIYNPWFRVTHLLSVLVVPAEDVFRFRPLNTLEGSLRPISANTAASSQVGNLLDRLLRHTIPGPVLDVMYWTLGASLLLLLLIVRPHFRIPRSQ